MQGIKLEDMLKKGVVEKAMRRKPNEIKKKKKPQGISGAKHRQVP